MASMVQIARGNSDEGVALLEKTAASFAAMGMLGDAGFVKLDIVDELLSRGDWGRAESTARELATLCTAAGVTTASVLAIDFLRQAVESGQATTNTIEYVRAYVAVDDASQPFILPQESDA